MHLANNNFNFESDTAPAKIHSEIKYMNGLKQAKADKFGEVCPMHSAY